MSKQKNSPEKMFLSACQMISDHPGPLDQYSDLRKILKKCGFKTNILFRGRDFQLTSLAGRYEIWITYPGVHSKEGIGNSLGEAVKDTIESLYSMNYIISQRKVV